jgi:hypothetical protein
MASLELPPGQRFCSWKMRREDVWAWTSMDDVGLFLWLFLSGCETRLPRFLFHEFYPLVI